MYFMHITIPPHFDPNQTHVRGKLKIFSILLLFIPTIFLSSPPPPPHTPHFPIPPNKRTLNLNTFFLIMLGCLMLANFVDSLFWGCTHQFVAYTTMG